MTKFLILGGASCIWEDIEASQEIFIPDEIIAINDIGIYVETIDHWVTMHPLKMSIWLKQRNDNGFAKPIMWTANHKFEEIKGLKGFKGVNSSAGGGVLAVQLARFRGATKVVLAGVPMTREHCHFNKVHSWMEADLYKQFWRGQKRYPYIVKSMSGWTKELYGLPTEEWLKET